jgi:hypothetical protein
MSNHHTPKIEAHLRGHDEPEYYAVFHDGRFVANLDPDADIGFVLGAARRGVGPTAPSFDWTRTLVVLHNQIAQVETDRAARQAPAVGSDNEPF